MRLNQFRIASFGLACSFVLIAGCNVNETTSHPQTPTIKTKTQTSTGNPSSGSSPTPLDPTINGYWAENQSATDNSNPEVFQVQNGKKINLENYVSGLDSSPTAGALTVHTDQMGADFVYPAPPPPSTSTTPATPPPSVSSASGDEATAPNYNAVVEQWVVSKDSNGNPVLTITGTMTPASGAAPTSYTKTFTKYASANDLMGIPNFHLSYSKSAPDNFNSKWCVPKTAASTPTSPGSAAPSGSTTPPAASAPSGPTAADFATVSEILDIAASSLKSLGLNQDSDPRVQLQSIREHNSAGSAVSTCQVVEDFLEQGLDTAEGISNEYAKDDGSHGLVITQDLDSYLPLADLQISTLTLQSSGKSIADLTPVGKMTGLNSLELDGFVLQDSSAGTTNPGYGFIKNLSNLTTLTLKDCDVNSTLAIVKGERLQKLVLSGNHMSSDVLFNVWAHGSLKSIEITANPLPNFSYLKNRKKYKLDLIVHGASSAEIQTIQGQVSSMVTVKSN